MRASNHKLADIDLTKMLQPAAELRPGAAQRCMTKQDHGLDTGLDVVLIPQCEAALPPPGVEPQPVYIEEHVLNTQRCARLAGPRKLVDDEILLQLCVEGVGLESLRACGFWGC